MKNSTNFLIVIFTILYSSNSIAQIYSTICDAQHEVTSTDWNNPVNEMGQRPVLNPERYLNGFNWNVLTGIPLTDMNFAGVPLGNATAQKSKL